MPSPRRDDDLDAERQEVLARLESIGEAMGNIAEHLGTVRGLEAEMREMKILLQAVDARTRETARDVEEIEKILVGAGDGRTGLVARLTLLEERNAALEAQVHTLKQKNETFERDDRVGRRGMWTAVACAAIASGAAIGQAVLGLLAR